MRDARGLNLLRGSTRRILTAFFAVSAVVFGLLAMHVMITLGASPSPDGSGMTSHHVMSETSRADLTTSPMMNATPDGCAGTCSPEHDMISMICVLALLVTLLLLTVQLFRIPWDELRLWSRAHTPRPNARPAPKPPSLHALSISRT
jgi:hypothetical protein